MRGNQLREVRTRLGVSLEQLAARTGLKYRLLYSLDSGERPRTNVVTGQIIAGALGVHVSEIWPITDNESKPRKVRSRPA